MAPIRINLMKVFATHEPSDRSGGAALLRRHDIRAAQQQNQQSKKLQEHTA